MMTNALFTSIMIIQTGLQLNDNEMWPVSQLTNENRVKFNVFGLVPMFQSTMACKLPTVSNT